MNKAKKIFWITLAIISLATGCIGIILPILPTTPFLLLASFSFARGSEKFHNWFLNTKIYKKYLEPFEKTKAMSIKTKLFILLPVSTLLLISVFMINNIYGRLVVTFLLCFKWYYFIFKIKTIKAKKLEKNNNVISEV